MLRTLIIVFAFLVAAQTRSLAATSEPYVGNEPEDDFIRVFHVGCRLGTGAGALPARLAMHYTGSAASQKLDVTVKLYVEWLYDTEDPSGEPQYFDPPLAIDDEDFAEWFDGPEFFLSEIDQVLNQKNTRHVQATRGSRVLMPRATGNSAAVET
jgi:hypothetical protein